MEVLVNVLIEGFEVPEELSSFLMECGERVMGAEGCGEDAELSIAIVDDAGIQELNSKYRGIDSPTDVLSFPQEDDRILGDVVISLETAERQASEEGRPLKEELCILLIHGVLHLLGYDHEEEEEAEEMEEREAEIKAAMSDLLTEG